jgi:hypothetical protein
MPFVPNAQQVDLLPYSFLFSSMGDLISIWSLKS